MAREILNLKSQISNCDPPRRLGFTPGRRLGFTLVEILVVITIIGMLVALLLPAINGVRKRAKQARIKVEISQLVAAIEDFKSKIGGGRYPPDGTNPSDMQQFCQGAFPRVIWGSGSGQVPLPYVTPDTALTFWLGGGQDTSGSFIGLSGNPTNPFDASPSRISPFFDFQRAAIPGQTPQPGTRLILSTSGSGTPLTAEAAAPAGSTPSVTWYLYQYIPQNDQVGTAPYLYFKPVAGQYGTINSSNITYSIWVQPSNSKVITPYKDAHSWAPAPYNNKPCFAWMNPQTYQLLCPGMDGKYGYAANGTGPGSNTDPADSKGYFAPLYSDGTNYDQANGLDDMTNFTSGATVGDDAAP